MLDISLLEKRAALQEQYQDRLERIATLRRLLKRLEHETVADVVTGSREDLSYGAIKVSGRPEREYKEVLTRIKQLESEAQHITSEALDVEMQCEDWLEVNIDKARIRMFLRQRYYDGDTWELIGRRIGSPSCTPEQAVKRYLKAH